MWYLKWVANSCEPVRCYENRQICGSCCKISSIRGLDENYFEKKKNKSGLVRRTGNTYRFRRTLTILTAILIKYCYCHMLPDLRAEPNCKEIFTIFILNFYSALFGNYRSNQWARIFWLSGIRNTVVVAKVVLCRHLRIWI